MCVLTMKRRLPQVVQATYKCVFVIWLQFISGVISPCLSTDHLSSDQFKMHVETKSPKMIIVISLHYLQFDLCKPTHQNQIPSDYVNSLLCGIHRYGIHFVTKVYQKKQPQKPHLKSCKHSRPLVAKAVHLHGSELLLRVLFIHFLLHLPIKFFLFFIFIISYTFIAPFGHIKKLVWIKQNHNCSMVAFPIFIFSKIDLIKIFSWSIASTYLHLNPQPVVLLNGSLLGRANSSTYEVLQNALQLFPWGPAVWRDLEQDRLWRKGQGATLRTFLHTLLTTLI